MSEEDRNRKEEADKSKEETPGKKEETTETNTNSGSGDEGLSPIEQANLAAERLEKANKERERLQKKDEKILAELKLQGRSSAGGDIKPPELNPKAYRKKVEEDLANGKYD